MATDKLINQSQGDDIINALDNIATNLNSVSYGEQTSADKVVAMTGYQKESTAAAISPGDSLNVAIGKLEKKVDDNATAIESKVSGPVSTYPHAIAIYSDATGKVLDDSEITIVDSSEGVIETDGSIPTCMAVSDLVMSTAAELIERFDGKILPIQSDLAALEGLPIGRLNIPNVRDITSEEFVTKTWSGLTSFDGWRIWSDGFNIYYSEGTDQYVLDKSNSTWSKKTWFGLTSFYSSQIWTDGENIYYSNGSSTQYVLNKSTSTWITKTWNGLTSFYGSYIWSDGENIYCSYESDQYVLNKATSTWSTKTWTGLTSFYSVHIWTDGENIYYSMGSDQYVLNKVTSTWSAKTWFGFTSLYGKYIWTDGRNIYYSNGTDQYVLNKSTSTWSAKTWTGLTSFSRDKIWTDGINFYYSSGSTQYLLKRNTPTTREVMGYVNDQTDNKVTGPGSSCTNAIAIYSDTTGKALADSEIYIERTQLNEANDKVPTCEVVENAIFANAVNLLNDISHVSDRVKYNTNMGVKNICNNVEFNNGAVSHSNTSFNTLTDGTVTVKTPSGETSTTDTNNFYNVWFVNTTTVVIPEGTWMCELYGTDISNIRIEYSYILNGTTTTIKGNFGEAFEMTIPTGISASWLRICAKPSTSFDSSFKIVVCNKAAWEADPPTEYIPFAKSNYQLTAEIGDKLDKTEKGAVSGVAELDANGKVPSSQLPSSMTPSSHTHGSITNDGTITASGVALASGDSFVFVDSSDSSKIKKTSVTFDGSTTTKALTPKGTFETFLQSHQTVKQDGVTGATVNRFGTCSTAAATADKTVSITSGTFNLEAGARVSVKFTNANTADTPTLNVNSKGAKNIYSKGSQITTGSNKSLLAGTVDFIYDGTQWHLIGNYIDTNTTYSSKSAASGGTDVSLCTTGEKYTWNSKAAGDHNHNLSIAAAASGATASINLSANTIYTLTAGGKTYNFKTPVDNNTYPSAYCSTAAATAAKVATCTGYVLLSKSYIHVIITTANTSASALTLNINSKGAKPIYINGSASSSSNYTLPAGSYLVYYNGTNYYFRTDGKVTAAGIVDIGGNTGLYFKGDGTLATPYTHPTTAGNKHIPSGGSSGQVLVYGGSSGTAAWGLPDKLKIRSLRYAQLKAWTAKTWSGLTNFNGQNVWTDGTNIYYSVATSSTSGNHYVLNGSTWTAKTWSGFTGFSGRDVWTDGTNIYCSYVSNQYVLNGSTWTAKTWSGFTYLEGSYIWTDGANIYFSCSADEYVLSGSTWTAKSWSGLNSFYGNNVWTDGANIYYSSDTTQYVLNGSTWSTKTWSGLTNFNGYNVWTDGTAIYHGKDTSQQVLDKSSGKWTAKTWSGLTNFNGQNVWTDGTNIYYSNGTTQYVLTDKKSVR